MKRLLEFLQDGTGSFSSTRLFMLMVAFSAIIDWQHAVWSIGVWTPQLDVLIFISSVLGLKIWQNYTEKK